jgi:rhodanese-related sulfurtransferase
MPITYNANTISPAEARNLMENGAILLDPITPEAHERRHIQGALNICVYEIAFISKVPERLPDKTVSIVVYGNTATSHEALAAAAKLSKLGYANVYVSEGGIEALVEGGFQTVGKDDSLVNALTYVSKRYEANTEHSVITWTGRNINGGHTGTVALKKGVLCIEGEIISGGFTVDMTQMTNSDLEDPAYSKMLIGHLGSNDFFSVKTFPEARFTIETAERTDDATISSVNHILHGKLTICGVTRNFDIPATIVQRADNSLILEAHFDFNRTLWGIEYGSARFFKFLGMHMIFDPVSIALHIELKASE